VPGMRSWFCPKQAVRHNMRFVSGWKFCFGFRFIAMSAMRSGIVRQHHGIGQLHAMLQWQLPKFGGAGCLFAVSGRYFNLVHGSSRMCGVHVWPICPLLCVHQLPIVCAGHLHIGNSKHGMPKLHRGYVLVESRSRAVCVMPRRQVRGHLVCAGLYELQPWLRPRFAGTNYVYRMLGWAIHAGFGQWCMPRLRCGQIQRPAGTNGVHLVSVWNICIFTRQNDLPSVFARLLLHF